MEEQKSLKVCRKCKLEFPVTMFWKQRSRKDYHHPHCKNCRNEQRRQWIITNRDTYNRNQREWYNKRQKISLEDTCDICNKPSPVSKDGRQRRLAKDHDHQTGLWRGKLCADHNKMLGYAQDDIGILEEAIRYLQRWKKNHLINGVSN